MTRIAAGLAALPVLAVLGALQGFVVGPLTRNYKAIPNVIFKIMRKVLGLKVEFNAASAPLVKDKPVWFLANHMSFADILVLGGTLNGAFVGKGAVLKWPVIGQFARAGKTIGIRRESAYNAESRGKIAKNFNAGSNTLMFPEATTTEGKQVHLFHAGLLTLLYGDKALDKKNRPVSLRKDVVVQSVAIRVKSVNGKDATGSDELRNLYSLPSVGFLRQIWKRLQLNTTLELTVSPPLDPKDFDDAKALANKAAQNVADIINPGQTTFTKANLPLRALAVQQAA